ncbi:MAG: AMP-binding protein [Dehalococcoidia bacterium]
MTTTYEEIAKDVSALKAAPNMPDYEALLASFSWDAIRAELDLPGGVVNLAHECVDRHAAANPAKTAMIWEGANGAVENYSFEDMRRESAKFASVLGTLGLEKGERVFFLMDRVPELYFSVFGTLRRGAVVCPLFSAFGPDPIAERINRAQGAIVITSPALYPKIEAIRERIPTVRQVIVIGDRAGRRGPEGATLDYATLMQDAVEAPLEPTGNEDWSIIHFTSGTTGLPKGGSHVHGAVLGHYATGKYVQDLQPDDGDWCTADPGWVTGTLRDVRAVVERRDEPDLRGWVQLGEVVRADPAPPRDGLVHGADGDPAADEGGRRDSAPLRPLESALRDVGRRAAQPPEGVVWGLEAFGLPFHDNWWQTETAPIADRELPLASHPSRLDGQAIPRRPPGGHRRRVPRDHGARRGGAAGHPRPVALDDARLLARRGALQLAI